MTRRSAMERCRTLLSSKQKSKLSEPDAFFVYIRLRNVSLYYMHYEQTLDSKVEDDFGRGKVPSFSYRVVVCCLWGVDFILATAATKLL